MKTKIVLISLLLITTSLLIFSGCESEENGKNMASTGIGKVKFRLKRSSISNSDIPSEADSAAVRIWHDGSGINRIKIVKIPDPNTNTEVVMMIPANNNYSVAIIAYASNAATDPLLNPSGGFAGSIPHVCLAGGRTDNINITVGDTTNVSVDVVPWKIEIVTNKDTLVGGGTFDITLNITQGPSGWEFFRNSHHFLALEPWTKDGDTPVIDYQTGLSATLDVPDVNIDSTAWYQAAIDINFETWPNFGLDAALYYPTLVKGDSLKTFPVIPPTGGVNITF
jgi:hypothetical protein